MNTFANLKQNSSQSLERLSEQLAKVITPSFNSDDDRFWPYPEVDKAGNALAVIRFLDSPKNEDTPFVRLWEHRFKGPVTGSWYIEKCLTTIGKSDPVAEHNNALWNSGLESDKALARDRKRQLYFISNILVIKDPQRPENDGKVFLFRYGKKIYDKLNDLMTSEKINPFDFWTGANFKLKLRTVEGYRNYDMSGFESQSPVHTDDSVIEAIWNKEHKLQPFIDEKNFKTYEQLKVKLDRVLGTKPRVIEDKPTTVVGFNGEGEDDDEIDASFKERMKMFQDQMQKDTSQ